MNDQGKTKQQNESSYKIMFLALVVLFCLCLVLLFTSCEKEEYSYTCTLEERIESNPTACGYPYLRQITIPVSGGPKEIKNLERDRTFTSRAGNLTFTSTCKCELR